MSMFDFNNTDLSGGFAGGGFTDSTRKSFTASSVSNPAPDHSTANGISAGLSSAGGMFSSIGSNGNGPGTGGQLTSLGANIGGMFGAEGGAWGAAIGAALDMFGSSTMADKSKEEAQKSAAEFLKMGLTNMDIIKEQGIMQKGASKVALASTGSELTSGTSRAVQGKVSDITERNYNTAFHDMLKQYGDIKSGGGTGGLF